MYCTILSTVVAELLQSEVLCDVSLTADVRQTVNNLWGFFLNVCSETVDIIILFFHTKMTLVTSYSPNPFCPLS